MNTGIMTAGIVGVAALGALLYRKYKHETSAPQQLRRPDLHKNRADTPDPTPPVQHSAAQISSEQAPAIRTPITTDAAMRPRRIARRFLTLPPIMLLALIALAFVLRGDYRIATTLGIVQGLGEFLPVSSSAHLILTPWLFRWTDSSAFYNTQSYDVALHVGTLLALVSFFRQDWLRLVLAAPRPHTEDGRMFWLLVVASAPGAAIGFLLDHVAEDFFRDKHVVIAAALAIMGLALYVADRIGAQHDELSDVTLRKALAIGVAQSLAFIPGVSRSGATMTVGRALGLQRETAARFSFLMATPITFGAMLLKLKNIEASALGSAPFWLGIGVSFAVGVPAIGFLLRYLKTNSYLPFVLYRVGLAALVISMHVARNYSSNKQGMLHVRRVVVAPTNV